MAEQLTYAQAINTALDMELEASPNALLFGEDVAEPGGVFGVTRGLHKKYGARVIDTPISESAILGGAVGSAMMGMRPIVEIMWSDFSLVALDQIVNQAANVRYVSQGRVTAPITIRTQQGHLPGSCAQHSQCLETLFAHVPGLYVGLPSNPQDAFQMLRAAMAADDPVLVIESRGFYHSMKGEVDTTQPLEPVSGARVLREGDDVTLVSWGTMMPQAEVAAEALRQEGISVDLVDLRWVRPLDLDTILISIAKTGRLVVAHEAHTFLGVSSEILAAIAERGVVLKAPPARVGAAAARIPAAPTLQAAVIPSQNEIIAAVRRVLGEAR